MVRYQPGRAQAGVSPACLAAGRAAYITHKVPRAREKKGPLLGCPPSDGWKAAGMVCLAMTKLLEAAIAKVRELSEDEQDAAADALFAHIARDHRCYELTPEQVADVQRIQRDLRAGRSRLATDAEMAEFWKRLGQ